MDNKEIKNTITQKALIVMESLDWKIDIGKKGTVRALKYPYAFAFCRDREMINLRGARHPDLTNIKLPQRLESTRIAMPLESNMSHILKTLNEKLIPRVIERTNKLMKEWEMENAKICEV